MPRAIPKLAIDTVKILAAETVEKANSGHPGTPVGIADLALQLWADHLRLNPEDPHWRGRDRFVLSAGHACALQYALLHLFGFGLGLDDLKRFRQLGSPTPGHPENTHTKGIEVTTGPLGQGIANGVGLALAERMLGERVNTAEFSPASGRTWVLAGDGCMMEGVALEAISLAGHLKLGNLTLIYDRNRITIDGKLDITFSEDVPAKMRAQGWLVKEISAYDQAQIHEAMEWAKATTDAPTLIIAESVIGHGAPGKEGTPKAHGEPLGKEALQGLKNSLGWGFSDHFHVPQEVREWFAQVVAEKKKDYLAWTNNYSKWAVAQPAKAALWDQLWTKSVPSDFLEKMNAGMDGKDDATRQHSFEAINRAAQALPWFCGGSADLAASNKTEIKGDAARNIPFGIREHGMGAIINGMNLHGAWRAFGATFLQFSDYMRPAIRLASLSQAPSIFVFTHDSIFLGEDGPTHQPVEHLASLRLIPGMQVWRPADGLETSMTWAWAATQAKSPTVLCFSRQKTGKFQRSAAFKAEDIWRGAYVLNEDDQAAYTLLATGSELNLACKVEALLRAQGLRGRVVSMPCVERFMAEADDYRQQVLGSKPIITLEAGVTAAWRGFSGTQGLSLGVDRFGASAPEADLATSYELTPEAVSKKILNRLNSSQVSLEGRT